MSCDWAQARVLFRFNGVPVKSRPSFWPMWLSSWPALILLARWRPPRRSWASALLVGTLSVPLTLLADVGHALAHTVSAKAAKAPMDEIHLAADMPRTIYFANDVSPDQHRLRALGGPIYSFTALLLSLLWRQLARPGTAAQELAEVSAVAHGFIFFGSLFPLPMVDGGTLLKWSLVARGTSAAQADQQVKRAGMMGILAVLSGAAVWLARRFASR